MDPILLVIKYLFKKKNIINNDDSIDAFFSNGASFPQFIAMIFNVNEKPGSQNSWIFSQVTKTPKSSSRKKINNDIAFRFLIFHNESIRRTNPSYNSARDQINLLLQILTKQCFIINISEIIKKCNIIVQPLNIKYSKKSDLINANCILSILHVLTDGDVQINNDSTDFDEIMQSSFQQANAPLVINKSSMEPQYHDTFLIQLIILFDQYSEKIKQIEKSPNLSIESQNKSLYQSNSKDHKNSEDQIISENKEKLKSDDESKEKVKSKDKQKSKPKEKAKSDDEEMSTESKEKVKSKDIEKAKSEDNEEMSTESKEKVKSKDKKKTKSKDIEKAKSEDDEEMRSEKKQKVKSKDKEKAKSEEVLEIKSEEISSEKEEEKEEEETKFEFEEVYKNDQEDNWKNIDEKSKKRKRKTDANIDSESSESDGIDKEEHLEGALLRTLNIVSKNKFHFNNFHESIINDSIPKYVMFLLNLKSITNVHLNEETETTTTQEPDKDRKITKEELENIQAVIEFLKTKEPTFEILKFDFANPTTEESSAFQFYYNLLTFFFLKKTKREMYSRCAILLSTKDYKEDYENYFEFTRMKTFSALLSFYVEQNLHFDYNELPDDNERVSELFDRAGIPMIISSKIMRNTSTSNISDIILYQLQFILDAIDSGPTILHIIEAFLYAHFNLKKIEVPRFESLAANIRAKRTSLEFQQARSENYLNRQNVISKSDSLTSDKMIISKTNKIKPPKTYVERRQETNKLQENNENSLETKRIDSFDKFWNSTDVNFGYENGIMYNKKEHENNQKESQKKWNNEIKNIQKNTQKKKSDKEDKAEIFKKTRKSFQSKLYKLFYYDEKAKLWSFDQSVFEQFSTEKKIDVENSITPLVFINNSFDDDSRLIAYNLMGGLYPNLDSNDQIFVYGFCDKTLSTLNFQIDFTDKVKASIKPIFLLVNVPQSKQNLPNLQSIIFQIYSFLSFICDLEIVALNKKYYLDQIELTRNLKDISRSFNKIKEFNIKKNIIQNDNYTDIDDEEEEEEEVLEEDVDEKTHIKYSVSEEILFQKELISTIKPKNSKIIFLVDDETVHFNDELNEKLNENKFFNEIKLKFDKNEAFINFINIKKIETYEAFLTSFNNILISSNSTFSDLKTNFQCIELFKFSSIYCKLRCNESTWKDELKQIILKRYSQIESSRNNKENSFEILSNLKDEITTITPLIDNDFINESRSILSEIKSEGNKKNRDILEAEIKKSSKKYLKYLTKKINSRFYWTEEQMDVMLNTYVDFLKNEYFDIIRLNTKEKIYDMIYEENYDIVENQIKTDKIKIDELFQTFIDKINTKKNTVEQDIKEDIQKGTNYAMKETENLREIKVTVQVNQDLKSEIEQDF